MNMNNVARTPYAQSMQPKLITMLAIGLVLLSITFLGYYAFRPVERTTAAVQPMLPEQCKMVFDAIVADTVTSIDADEAEECGPHFASWAKAIPDTKFTVSAGSLDVRGTSISLAGAHAWRTNYNIGNEVLPAVVVVTDATAATLRFQRAADATAALASIQAAAQGGK